MFDWKIAAVIPALDEEGAISDVIRAIPRELDVLAIVVDNGSRDATAERAREAGAIVVSEPRRGYGRACATGLRSLPASCEIVVFLDGDGSDDASSMERLVAPVRDGRYDFVIGSRIRGLREPGSMAPHQLFAGRIAGAVIAFAYGVRYTDMCPYRAISRRRLDALGMREETYGWNVEMQVLAARAGLRILELPVDHRNRRAGISKVSGNLRASVVAALRILAVLVRAALRRRSKPHNVRVGNAAP
jgi:glycosyltransferase involved in cell wall biosynthesis